MESFFRDGAEKLKKLDQRLEQAEDGLLGKGKQFVATAGEFTNGEDLGAPAGQRAAHDVAVGTGGNVLALADTVEFIHFGTVYHDDASRFPAPKLNDSRKLDLSKERGARGVMFRAALHRETILLGSFIRAQMAALVAEEQMMGSVGTIAAFASELFGAAGGFGDRPTAFDFAPYLEKVRPIGAALNVEAVDYTIIHKAGVDLHDARASYRKFLASYVDKRLGKKQAPAGSTGILDSVPLLSGIVPDAFKSVLGVVQNIAFKVFDIHAAFVAEISLRMEPAIERACREMSVYAIRERSSPMFDVWRLPPHPGPAETKDVVDKADITRKVDKLPGFAKDIISDIVPDLGGAIDDVNEAGHKVQEALDFLSRPGGYTKGRPYLDMAFMIDPDFAPDRPDWASLKLADALGQTAVAAVERVLGFKMPGAIGTVVAKITALAAEFLRAVYGKLITLSDDANPTEKEFRLAARDHLVHQVIEALIGMVPDIDKVRGFRKTIQGFTVNVEALIARGKEFIAREIGGALDGIIGFAMRDLHGMLMGVRNTAKDANALTMEVYLGLLPALFARIFRNIFFPIWDLLLHQGMKALSDAIGFENDEALRMIRMARRQVDLVQKTMEKASKLLEGGIHLLGKDPQVKEDREIIKSMFDLDPLPDAPAISDPLAAWFPLPARKPEVSSARVTDEHFTAVEPSLKWKEEEPDPTVPAATEAAGTGGAGTGTAGGATRGAKDGAGNGGGATRSAKQQGGGQ
jgi:hypothetical protein